MSMLDENPHGAAPPFAGKVAMITGAARGQGRSHALELARLGADVVVCDICHDLGTVGYPLAGEADLAETVRLVEEQGRSCVSEVADVRDLAAMVALADRAREQLGSIDILVANAGISTLGSICTMDAVQWNETIDTNLTGVFNAMRAVAPHMRRQRSGRIIAISSMMGRSSNPGIPAYVASKWGVIGLCKSVAFELAGFGLMRPDLEHPGREDVAAGMAALHVQPVPWIEPEEITAAVVFLASEAARHISGSVIDVDAGASARFTG
jgi:NAD(P)-dependent dehydrogenase (short-subunit alcohol dehydrogenase family)